MHSTKKSSGVLPAGSPHRPALDRMLLEYADTRQDGTTHIGAALRVIGRPPSREGLIRHLRARIPRVPVLTQVFSRSGGSAAWREDPEFDLDNHVHEIRMPPGSVFPDTFYDGLLALPLPTESPRWSIWLCHGFAPDHYLVCYVAHHAFQDGNAMSHTLDTLFGSDVPPRESPASWRLRPAEVPGLIGQVIRETRPATPWPELAPPCGDQRTMITPSVPLQTLESIGRARGGTANDTYMAVVAGMVRAWSLAAGAEVQDLQAILPLSIRRPRERPDIGNRLAWVRLPLPCTEPHPARRLTRLIPATARARRRRALLGLLHDALPERALAYLVGQVAGTRGAHLWLTSLRIKSPCLFVGPDPVDSVDSFFSLDEGYMMTALLSAYAGQASVTFVVDRSLPEPEALLHGWVEGVAKLAAATRPDAED